MARKIIIISDILKIDDKTSSIGGGLIDQEVNESIISKIIDKELTVNSNGNKFKIKILNTQISYSLSGFKNLFFLVSSNDVKKIHVGDEVFL